jgi:hypothetical protein
MSPPTLLRPPNQLREIGWAYEGLREGGSAEREGGSGRPDDKLRDAVLGTAMCGHDALAQALIDQNGIEREHQRRSGDCDDACEPIIRKRAHYVGSAGEND